jgi:hypothetical protein
MFTYYLSFLQFSPLLSSGDVETLRQYFDCLDITQTGSLSSSDLWPLAEALVIRLGAGTRGSFLFFASVSVDTNWNGYMEFDEFCTLFHCLASRGKSRKNFVWRNVDYDFDYSQGNKANQPPKGNINSAYSRSIPLTLLSAIGFSILASRRKWLQTLEQESRLTKVDLIEQKNLVLLTTLFTRLKKFRVFPSLQTPCTDIHSKSCFCGCRLITPS